MNCKKCNKELPDSAMLCPYCGALQAELEEQEVPVTEAAGNEELLDEIPLDGELEYEDYGYEDEEPEKNGLKRWQWWLTIGCAVILLAVVIGAVLYGMGVDLRPRENDIYYKDSYTAFEDEMVKKSGKVVATMGTKELTVGELQMHYQNVFFSFYSQNYYYLSFIGLDITAPLDEQYVPGMEDMTWQQYFIDQAINNWQSYALMELIAEEEGYAGSPEVQEVLTNLEATALERAQAYGYETVDAWLLGELGPGVTLNDYIRYNTAYYMGSDYLNHFYETNDPTDEEVDAYYAENQETFAANGITPDLGLNSSVRHILIAPQGGTTAEDGTVTYTEEEWAAAYAEAERILQEWKDGAATEESFGELANTYSTDPGSNTTGGLYTDINVDASYMESFENWAIDPARVPGDTAIVETPYGYHIMYFVSGQDYCSMVVKDQLVADRVKVILQAGLETYPMEVNYKNIYVNEIKLY